MPLRLPGSLVGVIGVAVPKSKRLRVTFCQVDTDHKGTWYEEDIPAGEVITEDQLESLIDRCSRAGGGCQVRTRWYWVGESAGPFSSKIWPAAPAPPEAPGPALADQAAQLREELEGYAHFILPVLQYAATSAPKVLEDMGEHFGRGMARGMGNTSAAGTVAQQHTGGAP